MSLFVFLGHRERLDFELEAETHLQSEQVLCLLDEVLKLSQISELVSELVGR